ncbi:hypothetical protein NLJ89_g9776 [Agrocybe chaxingu]|uniref:F-box domain-containing protein n=1 Tax=Agrocybe chaxingu TaxID=84603 RepID=A0A9W8MPJ1_9AGAR|nr:hypothetical protein NLJ89_g9776 [Agrocybe chaxingu]
MPYTDRHIVQQVEELLLNNASPSDSLIPTINDLLEASRSQLSIIQGEMDELAKLLATVKQRFEATQQSITKHETILSPIRRVPADVLGEIFGHCLPTHRNPLFLSSEAPILPSHVCRSWRAVALSTPSLWGRLHVSLPGVVSPLSNVPSIDTIHANNLLALYPKIMKRRSDAVKEWLARSGASPLSVSIFAPTIYPEYLTENIHSAGEMVLDAIAPSCGRWNEIELTMPLDLYQIFETKFILEKPKNLTQLRLRLEMRMSSPFLADDSPPPPSIALLSAPNLKGVFLSLPSQLPFNFTSLDRHNKMAPIWAQLTRLFLHTMIPDTDVHLFLRACPRLVECGLWAYARAAFGPSLSTESEIQVGIIYLPNLQTFKITDDGSPATMRNTFASLSVPELRRVEYGGTPPYHHSSGQQPPLLVLLEAAQSIRTLHFEAQGMPKDTIVHCLRVIPNLRHLAIGGRPSPYNPEGEPSNIFQRPPYPASPFRLEDLIIEESPVDGVSDILLPSLESFEIYEPFSNVSDSTLQKFVCSRVGPAAARSGFSPLKRVKGHFQRPMEEDISKDVNRCAAEAGVEVDLDLKYLNEDSEIKNPLSVQYGLTQVTKQTWVYSFLES